MNDLPQPLTPAERDLPRTRDEAARAGATKYFTGEPCPRGHVDARYTLNGYCVTCQMAATRASRDKIRAWRRQS